MGAPGYSPAHAVDETAQALRVYWPWQARWYNWASRSLLYVSYLNVHQPGDSGMLYFEQVYAFFPTGISAFISV